MGTFKGTKGEWRVVPQSIPNAYDIVSFEKGMPFGESWVASTVHVDKDSETIQANAKLLSLAPELLQALKHILPNMEAYANEYHKDESRWFKHTFAKEIELLKKASES